MRLSFDPTRWSPNRTRLVWDVLSSVFSSVFVVFYQVFLIKAMAPWVLFVGPIAVIAFNYALGIYTRSRIGSGFKKGGIFFVSVVLSAIVMSILGSPLAPTLLWASFLWPLLSLPRMFLNIHSIRSKANSNILAKVVKQRGPVLVVGGAGYIGTHVVNQLLLNGYPVRILDRFMYGREPIRDFADKIEVIDGDATDIQKLTQAMNGASAVVHLAGLVGDPACAVDAEFTRHANIVTTRMVKEIAMSFGVSRFIFASSCSVYGVSDIEVNETSALNPVSLYARTKIDSERELLLCQADDFDVTILRFATVFGHSWCPRFDLVANLFVAQAMMNGSIRVIGPSQWRPFVHVRDLARSVVATLKASPSITGGQIFNVGDRRLNLTIGDLGKLVAQVISKERPVEITVEENPSDLRNYAVSFEKIRKNLGFEASVLLEPGLQEIVSEFKKGTYGNYQDSRYSNVSITKKAVESFWDPMQVTNLYQPLNEQKRLPAK